MINNVVKKQKNQKNITKCSTNKSTLNSEIIKNPQKQIEVIYSKLRQNFYKDKLFNTQLYASTQNQKQKHNHIHQLTERNMRFPKIYKNNFNPLASVRNIVNQQVQNIKSFQKITEKNIKELKFMDISSSKHKQLNINKIFEQYKKSNSAKKLHCQQKKQQRFLNLNEQQQIKQQNTDRVRQNKKNQKSKQQKQSTLLKTLQIHRLKYGSSTVKEQISLPSKQNNQNHKQISVQKKDKSKIFNQIMRKPKKINSKDLIFQFPIFSQNQFINLIKSYYYIENAQNNQGYYKAFIGNGNNSFLIKKCLKVRGYWLITQSIQKDTNFVWTQKKNKFIQTLPQRKNISENIKQKNKIRFVNSQTSSNLLFDFLKNHKNQYEYLNGIQNIFSKPNFQAYVDKIIKNFIRNGKKKPLIRLCHFLESRRVQIDKVAISNPHEIRLHNHIESASSLGNKKGLFYYMKNYCQLYNKDPFQIIPQTIHLPSSKLNDIKSSILTFDLPCLLKPGELTNRGQGITIHYSWNTLYEAMLKNQTHRNGVQRTHIIQRYIMPFLYNNRKFDIRMWVLWSNRQVWWYKQGYIRTSSKQFNIKSNSKYVHLTNDAIQKNSQDYGKYQAGNKLSFNQFQKYLEKNSIKHNFWQQVYPQMKKIAYDVFRIGNFTMDLDNKLFSYQLFGLDFMIDQNFKVWLIQVNTNPCLETSCSLLNRLIINMIQNVLSIVVDPLFPPPISYRKKINFEMENFNFQLLYDGYEEQQNGIFDSKRQTFDTEQDQFAQQEQTLK